MGSSLFPTARHTAPGRCVPWKEPSGRGSPYAGLRDRYSFPQNTDMEEGEMTKKRSHLVCENALFLYSTRLGLNDDLRLGKGELENGGKYRKAIVADIFESFLGALYLDKGYQEVSSFMETYIVPIMEDESLDFFDDYKSILQEQVQTDKRSLEYIVTKESGPAHHKTFTVIVKIDDMIYGEGVAHSKKEAENLAAKDALSKSCR